MSTHSELLAIGRVIREQRHFLGMSQIEFAALFDASPTTIYRVESGQDCRLSTLLKICDRLDLMLSELAAMAEEVGNGWAEGDPDPPVGTPVTYRVEPEKEKQMSHNNAPKILTVIFADTHRTMESILFEKEHVPYRKRIVQIELTPDQRKALEHRYTGHGSSGEMYEELLECWFEPLKEEEND